MSNMIQTLLPKWIKGSLYAQISGLSKHALEGKRRSGAWAEGWHWRKAPDGNIYYNWHEIDQWVEHGYKNITPGS